MMTGLLLLGLIALILAVVAQLLNREAKLRRPPAWGGGRSWLVSW